MLKVSKFNAFWDVLYQQYIFKIFLKFLAARIQSLRPIDYSIKET